MNIEIDINKVSDAKNTLRDLGVRLKNIKEESEEKTKDLKNYWESKSADEYFKEFDKYKKDFDKYLEEYNSLVNYLQEIVANGYKTYDENTNKVIEEDFSIFS